MFTAGRFHLKYSPIHAIGQRSLCHSWNQCPCKISCPQCFVGILQVAHGLLGVMLSVKYWLWNLGFTQVLKGQSQEWSTHIFPGSHWIQCSCWGPVVHVPQPWPSESCFLERASLGLREHDAALKHHFWSWYGLKTEYCSCWKGAGGVPGTLGETWKSYVVHNWPMSCMFDTPGLCLCIPIQE